MANDDKHSKLVVDLLEKNLEQSSKTQKCVNDLRSDFNLHVQATEYELKEIARTNEVQNTQLLEHSARSAAIQKDVEIREKQLRNDIFGEKGLEPRVFKLEEPRKLVKLLMKTIGIIGTVAGVIWVIIRLL